MSRRRAEQFLNSIWYGQSLWSIALSPLSWVYRFITALRRKFYQLGWIKSFKVACPVIVVGNITVGGVGKTPLVLYLVERLMERGIKPGVVTRGYGRRINLDLPHKVSSDDSADQVGDEAMMLFTKTSAPIYVDSDRVAAASRACQGGAHVVICDDGLQHYRLRRDLELAIIDGHRQLGNQMLIPAGPLREPKSRLESVDRVIVNHATELGENNSMILKPRQLVSLGKQKSISLAQLKGQNVHGVAAIGNPQRFFSVLRNAGLKVIEHEFPDHYYFSPKDFSFVSEYPIIMTEKDAAKCVELDLSQAWYLEVETVLSADLARYLDQQLQQLINYEQQ